MRRLLSAVLTIPLLLLAGCGGSNSDEQTALNLRAALQQAGGCRFVSEIHADCAGRLYDFSLEFSSDGETDTVTVLAPETIEGVSATVSEDGMHLVFEDVLLDFGMGESALSTPLLQPYLMTQCLISAYIAYTADTQNGTAVRYYYGYEEDRLEIEVVLDRASLTPKTCEIYQDGQVILSAEITDFELIKHT